MNAAWLLERGVPHEMILEENSSMETVGNAFFTKVLHADVLALQHIAGPFFPTLSSDRGPCAHALPGPGGERRCEAVG